MTNDLIIRKMDVKDVFYMRNFGKNKNILLKSYDFWPKSIFECAYWFYKKTEGKSKKYFSIIYFGRVIGYLSMKEIDEDEKTSTLGIVLDANFQSMGLGRKILIKFLNMYFYDYRFDELTLSVDFFNERAMRLYKSLNFFIYSRGYQLFDGVRADICDEDKKYFVFKGKYILSKVWFMTLFKENFRWRDF